jgi:hypothetical protein
MKNSRADLTALAVIGLFLLLAIASAPPRRNYQTYQPKPQPCVKHRPMTFSPLLIKLNIDGSYTMKDLPGYQQSSPTLYLDMLNGLTPYKYQLADGVLPNLLINITFNTDNYGHYGATVNATVYDGSFRIILPSNYITHQKLLEDITGKINTFVTKGWCSNCPEPCVMD